MYKAVNTDDVFNAVDGNRNKTMMSTPKATIVNTPPVYKTVMQVKLKRLDH